MTLHEQIAAAVGRPLSDAETAQVTLWEADIRADVATRAATLGVDMATIDEARILRFAREAVLARLRNPDGAQQIDVTVDDTRVTRRYAGSGNGMAYLPDWWAWLGLADTPGGTFQIDTTPVGAGVRGPRWWLELGRADW